MTLMRPKRTVSTVSPAIPKAAHPRAAETKTSVRPPDRTYALEVPFAARSVASAAGARWDETHKVWLWRGVSLPAALEPYAAQPYSLEAWVERAVDPDAQPRTASRPLSVIEPRPHQMEAIGAILQARGGELPGFLLADDVGLGKTISAWGAIQRLPDVETVLICCPLAVVAHWRRTIAAMGDLGMAVIVINYERLDKLFALPPMTPKKGKGRARAPAKKPKLTKRGIARRGEAMAFDVVVWDESHRLKNPTTARAKLAAKLGQEAGFVMWLSATAGQNPLELSYLAPLLAATTGDAVADLKDFEGWCKGLGLGVSRGAYGRWDWRGDPADCERMRALLFDPGQAEVAAGIRRRPEDVAGWPELNRMLTPIGLEGEARALYDEVWTEFRREMALAPQGDNPRGALAATLRLRQKSSLLRVPGTVELAKELLDNGHQVAISVAFIETLEALATALDDAGGIARIHGRMPAAERERERLRFQRGEARVCLFTVEEGISLHQGEHNDVPRSEVIHDLRWSAIQMAQIEGRCHRDGRFAQVYWAFADDTLEEKIAAIVCRRILAMKQMVGDDTDTLREIETLLRG